MDRQANHAPSLDDPRSLLAAKMFPQEWAATQTKRYASRARQRLRQRAEREVAYETAMAPLRDKGASCATCQHFERMPMTLNKMHCDLHSDFWGYAEAKPDGLCPSHKEKSNG